MTETSASPEPSAEGEAPRRPRKWRRWLAVFGATMAVLLVLVGVGGGTAEYYTSRPNFCGSCHIMKPYYDSWHEDVHGGSGGATCVDCHYAPGEQHTFMAKFRGLSQLTSYFSGRAGAGRPKAQVDNRSCMTSACHGNGAFIATEQKLGNVTFSHAKHLDPEGQMLFEQRQQLDQLRSRLLDDLGSERLTGLETIARAMQPAEDRDKQLAEWVATVGHTPLRAAVVDYGRMIHKEVRIEQLGGLKCSSCHQFDSTLKKHFTAAGSTCFTCHFTNEPFNDGAGECLTCHDVPPTAVPIHSGLRTASNVPTAPVMMDHATIVQNNVDCVSCHRDLVRGRGQVTQRDCQNCHDQQRFLKDFATRTTETVRAYHRVHTAGQRARCNDCHEVIEHGLTQMTDPTDAEALLLPVRQDCLRCHVDHHGPQVEMLLGRGGFVEDTEGVVNPMVGSRVNCGGCHTHTAESAGKGAVVRSTQESCRACHSENYVQLFDQWRGGIQARSDEAKSLLTRAEAHVTAAATRDEATTDELSQLVSRARRNIEFVDAANGMHNRHYATMLLDQAVMDLHKALGMLTENEGI